ncbi:MAG: protein translocase subunit SecD [Phototrophicaceae bacterium]
MTTHIRWLVVIILLSVFSVWVIIPKDEDFTPDFNGDDEPDITILGQQPLGLDLVGGLRVLLQTTIDPSEYTDEDLQETANNVGRRVNALGLSEATIQTQGRQRILVELPGETDRERAISTIQQTALLEFVDFSGLTYTDTQALEDATIITDAQVALGLADLATSTAARNPQTGQPFTTGLTGDCLQAASAQYGQTSSVGASQWFINFEVSSDCVGEFADFTQRLVGQPMAIVLDGIVISAPTVNQQLTTGGIITGNFSEEEAQQFGLQLRSGALRIPLEVESAVEVGATLGQQFLNDTIRAGALGAIIVFLFMLIYYRVPGISADIALFVFILLNLALFKLLPITLTLPAITGFLISIGTAVDGNVLIFERIKEELRAGKDINSALNDGFDRAWQSIRDSNISTIIICGILFLFGQTPGASVVSGFAVTLAIGLILNLFTAVTVTRTFLYLITAISRKQLEENKWLLGV